MRAFLVLLGCCCFGAAGATTYYKWVDADGVTHYTDRPAPGAKPIELYGVTPARDSGAEVPPQPTRTYDAPPADSGNPYTSVSITNPTAEQVFFGGPATVGVSASLEPGGLGSSHKVWFLLDGSRVMNIPDESTAATLPDVPRGEHTLSVRVLDSSGRQLIESPPVVFYVRQEGVGQPAVGPRLRLNPRPQTVGAATPPVGPNLRPKPKPPAKPVTSNSAK
jgi:hypothetical protein